MYKTSVYFYSAFIIHHIGVREDRTVIMTWLLFIEMGKIIAFAARLPTYYQNRRVICLVIPTSFSITHEWQYTVHSTYGNPVNGGPKIRVRVRVRARVRYHG